MRFSITFDYLCPFARNANEGVVQGLRDGREWDVGFQAFSLSQVHLSDGDTPVWERDDLPSGVLALAWGLAIRDEFPESFIDAHGALFAARHEQGTDINDEAVLRGIADSVGLDSDAVAAVVGSGRPLEALAADHTAGVERHSVFGVPTFIAGDEAVFVRLMTRWDVDAVDRVLDQLSWTALNEFKRTRVPR
ncbi:MAG TPA: DsbA family protein [Acidimicrobiia bacterium]|nr:DsbA family protein [Acidimicrobiia bacterium]